MAKTPKRKEMDFSQVALAAVEKVIGEPLAMTKRPKRKSAPRRSTPRK